jgi:hypothetical protein
MIPITGGRPTNMRFLHITSQKATPPNPTKGEKMKNQIRRAIIIPDMQCPYEDNLTMRAVEAYMADHRWDYYVNLGDFIDFREISRWEEGNQRAEKVGSILRSYEYANKVLDRHQQIVRSKNKSCKMALIEGNHEYRVEAYLDKNPESQGLIEVPIGLRLKERDIKWVPFWSKGTLYRVGNAYFAHGRYTNRYHAAKMSDVYGVAIYYGHTHDVMEFPKIIRGNDKTIVGKSLGCLCRYDQQYLRGNPTNWQQAFAVFTIFPDGYFTEHTVRIFKHRFEMDGKIYDGRKS